MYDLPPGWKASSRRLIGYMRMYHISNSDTMSGNCTRTVVVFLYFGLFSKPPPCIGWAVKTVFVSIYMPWDTAQSSVMWYWIVQIKVVGMVTWWNPQLGFPIWWNVRVVLPWSKISFSSFDILESDLGVGEMCEVQDNNWGYWHYNVTCQPD